MKSSEISDVGVELIHRNRSFLHCKVEVERKTVSSAKVWVIFTIWGVRSRGQQQYPSESSFKILRREEARCVYCLRNVCRNVRVFNPCDLHILSRRKELSLRLASLSCARSLFCIGLHSDAFEYHCQWHSIIVLLKLIYDPPWRISTQHDGFLCDSQLLRLIHLSAFNILAHSATMSQWWITWAMNRNATVIIHALTTRKQSAKSKGSNDCAKISLSVTEGQQWRYATWYLEIFWIFR